MDWLFVVLNAYVHFMQCEKHELTCNLTHVYAGYMVTALSLLCSNHLLFFFLSGVFLTCHSCQILPGVTFSSLNCGTALNQLFQIVFL